MMPQDLTLSAFALANVRSSARAFLREDQTGRRSLMIHAHAETRKLGYITAEIGTAGTRAWMQGDLLAGTVRFWSHPSQNIAT